MLLRRIGIRRVDATLVVLALGVIDLESPGIEADRAQGAVQRRRELAVVMGELVIQIAQIFKGQPLDQGGQEFPIATPPDQLMLVAGAGIAGHAVMEQACATKQN